MTVLTESAADMLARLCVEWDAQDAAQAAERAAKAQRKAQGKRRASNADATRDAVVSVWRDAANGARVPVTGHAFDTRAGRGIAWVGRRRDAELADTATLRLVACMSCDDCGECEDADEAGTVCTTQVWALSDESHGARSGAGEHGDDSRSVRAIADAMDVGTLARLSAGKGNTHDGSLSDGRKAARETQNVGRLTREVMAQAGHARISGSVQTRGYADPTGDAVAAAVDAERKRAALVSAADIAASVAAHDAAAAKAARVARYEASHA